MAFNIEPWLLPAAIGLFAGGVGGFFGISGAFIIISLLSFLEMVPNQKIAAGTTLFILLPPISILAVYTYWKNKEIDFKLAWKVMGFYILGGLFGAMGAHALSDKELKLLLAILFFILGIVSTYTYYTTK
jgi:uncharacterized membrane protein YfcA